MVRKIKRIIDERGQECTLCGSYKPYPEFNKNRQYKNGFNAKCRSCELQEKARERQKKKLESEKEIQKQELSLLREKERNRTPDEYWSGFGEIRTTEKPAGFIKFSPAC